MVLDAPSASANTLARRSRDRAPWWVWLLGLGLGAVHLLAHLGAAATDAPPEFVYLGFPHMVPDHASYLGFADQVLRSAALTMHDPYTTEPQAGRFVMIFFWLVGVLARATGVSVLVAWYLLTPLCSLTLVLVLWWLAGLLFAEPTWRRVAVLLTSLGGGLGWLAAMLSPRLAALELVRFDWNWSLLGAAMVPMWTLAHALLALAAGLVLHAAVVPAAPSLARHRTLRWPAVSVLLLLSYLVHPYTGLAGLVVVGVVALSAPASTSRPGSPLRARVPGLLAVAAGALGIGSLALWARGDLVYRVTSERVFSWTERYALTWYPLMYGALLLLALVGAAVAVRDPRARALRSVLAWCAATAVLSSLWFVPGVKFQYLVALPLGLLATQGLRAASEHLAPRWSRPAQQVVAALALIALAGGPLPGALRNILPEPGALIHVSQPQLDLLAALRQLPEGGVLAPPSVAILVPWKAGKHVYDGHWFLSPQHEARLAELRLFYRPDTPEAWKAELLARARVRYVVEDPWSTGLVPARLGPLVLVERFRNPFGRVLEVTAGAP